MPFQYHVVNVTALLVSMAFAPLAYAVQTIQASPRPSPPALPSGTAFVDVAVVPMDREHVLSNQTVLVQNGRITAMGPTGKIAIPAGVMRIDGQGKYLMPGLSNCYFWNDVRGASAMIPDTTRMLESQLLTELAHGVTSVRVVEWAHDFGRYFVRLRERAAAGDLISPRIYTSGQLWTRFDSLPEANRPAIGVWAGSYVQKAIVKPEEVAAQVAAYKAKGFDYIRYHDEFSLATPQGRAVWDSLVAAARREQLPIDAHLGMWWDSSQAGTDNWFLRHLPDVRAIDGLEGFTPFLLLDELNDSSARVMTELTKVATAMKQAGVWNCPSAFTYIDPVTVPRKWPDPSDADIAERWMKWGRRAARWRMLVHELNAKGMGVLYGTGRLYPSYIHGEILSLVGGAELTPYQSLRTATYNMAAFFGTLDSTGTVAVGKRADLVLFPYNPLDPARYQRLQDGASRWPAENYGLQPHPVGVMLGGRWLSYTDLEQRLLAMRAKKTVGP